MLQINPLDVVTTVLGLAYILFEYKASKWMWVVGFIMQSLGIVLYYQKGLYADCAMEFYYLAMTIYGFWKWQTHPLPLPAKEGQSRLPTARCPWPTALPQHSVCWASGHWHISIWNNGSSGLPWMW